MLNADIVVYVMPWEVESYRRSIQAIESSLTQTRKLSVSVYACLCVSSEIVNWGESSLDQESIKDEFYRVTRSVKRIDRINAEVSGHGDFLGCVDWRRHHLRQCESGKTVIWLDPDIVFPTTTLLSLEHALEDLDQQYYVVTPQLPRMWDDSWDDLVFEEFKQQDFDHWKRFDLTELERICHGLPSSSPRKLTRFKFAGGWFSAFSSDLLKLIDIPDSFSPYGEEDTYIMQVCNELKRMSRPVSQYLLSNVGIAHDSGLSQPMRSRFKLNYEKDVDLLNNKKMRDSLADEAVNRLTKTTAADRRVRNLLFVSIDGLRPMLNCYGFDHMLTPNFDALAKRGISFTRSFCQVPVCGGSRASTLTGIRPTSNRFTDYDSRADQDAPGIPTLMHHLKDHGFSLHGGRMVFHGQDDYADVWDSFIRSRFGFPGPYYSHESKHIIAENNEPRKPGEPTWVKAGPAYDCADIADDDQYDGFAASRAIEILQKRSGSGQPFMYCFGAIGAHLPFQAPKRYWDLYDRSAIRVDPHHRYLPDDVPLSTLHNWTELRNYLGIIESGPLDDELARTLTHGYMAGISYIDAQLGKLIHAMDNIGLDRNTAVVLWSDHGFNLGDHGLWCKHCLYDSSLHVPLIMVMPDRPDTAGLVVHQVVENLDLYPTVCDMLKIARPEHLEGRSLMPLIDDPNQSRDGAAFSRFRNGRSIRTEEFRYTEWTRADGGVEARALFDHRSDNREDRNLAIQPGYEEMMRELSARLSSCMPL